MSLPNETRTPNTETVRARYARDRYRDRLVRTDEAEALAEFDRWLAEHDRQVRAKVLSGATDTASTLVEFLTARLNDDRECYPGTVQTQRDIAEVESKRRILEEHDPGEGVPSDLMQCPVCDGNPNHADYPCRTLRLLALPYATHPDYRQEWAADGGC